mgnify:CR=1 FL=1
MQKQQDEELLRVFHLMTQKEKDLYLDAGKRQTAGRGEKKPQLRLVSGGLCTLRGGSRGYGFG